MNRSGPPKSRKHAFAKGQGRPLVRPALRLPRGHVGPRGEELEHRCHGLAVGATLVERHAPREEDGVGELHDRIASGPRVRPGAEIEDACGRADEPGDEVHLRQLAGKLTRAFEPVKRDLARGSGAASEGVGDGLGQPTHHHRESRRREQPEERNELPPAAEEHLALGAQERDAEEQEHVPADDAGDHRRLTESVPHELGALTVFRRVEAPELAPIDRAALRPRHRAEGDGGHENAVVDRERQRCGRPGGDAHQARGDEPTAAIPHERRKHRRRDDQRAEEHRAPATA